MSKWSYYRLLDTKHQGIVIRADGLYQERYYTENHKWVRSGIMLEYFCDESDTYDMYEEISEKAALEITGR